MTDEDVMEELQSNSSFNRARQEFSNGCTRIEQAQAQRYGLRPIQMRRMEFEAVQKIITAYNNLGER